MPGTTMPKECGVASAIELAAKLEAGGASLCMVSGMDGDGVVAVQRVRRWTGRSAPLIRAEYGG